MTAMRDRRISKLSLIAFMKIGAILPEGGASLLCANILMPLIIGHMAK
jgi:hypothetical protein